MCVYLVLDEGEGFICKIYLQNNSVALWQILDRPITSENGDAESLLVHEPQKVFETSHSGDVMDMQVCVCVFCFVLFACLLLFFFFN